MGVRFSLYRKYFKRPADVLLSFIAAVFLSPLMLVTALAVKIKLGSPVIFLQERPGLNGKIFTIYKFRTMIEERDGSGKLLPDKERLTGFGRFLRSSSIDELPELFNIIKGDMSLVGPRPLLVEYLPLYDAKQKRRHDVRPGLTGLSQVSGRNELCWDDKFALDVFYVENISFSRDCGIIAKTFLKAFRREGVNKNAGVSMEKFKGSGNIEAK